MSLKLMYITNNPNVMLIAENCGIDRIFIDMEVLGKEERQPKMDTVKSSHTIDDIITARKVLKKSEILVRINPINEGTKNEIEAVIEAGADIIMLPYFENAKQVKDFIEFVDGRVRTCLLLETDKAVENVDEIISVKGIDEIHIGINDLHLCYKKKFMFELLSDGTVEYLCKKFKEKNIPYGFGGIARLRHGEVPSELVIAEHYRLGSNMAIVSRSFCRTNKDTKIEDVKDIFMQGIFEIRNYEKTLLTKDNDFFEENKKITYDAIQRVVSRLQEKA